MKKIIFCDLNKGLCDKVSKLFEKHKNNKWDIDLKTHNGDIIEYHKNNGGKIATASNPNFYMGGGLDAVIAEHFQDEVKGAKEFKLTENLFFTITVDGDIKATESIVKRALIGCFAYAQYDIIISGFGTAIGGLEENVFLDILNEILSANLSYADLSNTNLSYADLRSANLSNANLSYANLIYVDLSNTNLSYADLRSANLSNANLRSAKLSYADLSYANLSNAKVRSTKEIDTTYFNEATSFFALACPEEGSFIGFKKVDNCVIKLKIPAKAKRSSATTRKCRCEYAKVLSITGKDGEEKDVVKNISHKHETIYKVGEYVYPNKWDDDRWNECSNGIHFFMTRKEAENWK